MEKPASAKQLFERLLEGIANGDWSRLAELYADDAVVGIPFAGKDGLTLKGRDAIAAHFSRAAAVPFSMRATNVRIYETDQPDMIVAEYDYEISNKEGASLAVTPNIQWVRAKDGLIAETHDYHHHQAIAGAIEAASNNP